MFEWLDIEDADETVACLQKRVSRNETWISIYEYFLV